MNKTILSIFHSLSVMQIEEIEQAKEIISREPVFDEVHKTGFLMLCDMAIEEKRRCQSGKRKV